MLAIIDNTVLSNFALVNRIILLSSFLGQSGVITEHVEQEFQEGINKGHLPEIVLPFTKIELSSKELVTFQQLVDQLNSGEASCLAAAIEKNGMILTDDRDARKFAAQLQVPISGTLGVLVGLVNQQKISLNEANVLLSEMIDAGYHSPINELNSLI